MSICAICTQDEVKEGLEAKVKIDELKMVKVGPVKLGEKEVFCWVFKDPSKKFRNKWASSVMGKDILGNAILLGLSKKEVEAKQPRSWAGLAKQLPVYIAAPPKPKIAAASQVDDEEDEYAPICGNQECDGCPTCDEYYTAQVEEQDIVPFGDF